MARWGANPVDGVISPDRLEGRADLLLLNTESKTVFSLSLTEGPHEIPIPAFAAGI